MSWSVSAKGTPAEVRGIISEQFKLYLVEPPAGISDAGERDTVQKAFYLIEQVTTTYNEEQKLQVTAYGSLRSNVRIDITFA